MLGCIALFGGTDRLVTIVGWIVWSRKESPAWRTLNIVV